MERFIPVGIFRKKGIPSELLPFSRFYRNDAWLYYRCKPPRRISAFEKKNAQNTLTMFYDGLASNVKVENLKSQYFIRST